MRLRGERDERRGWCDRGDHRDTDHVDIDIYSHVVDKR